MQTLRTLTLITTTSLAFSITSHGASTLVQESLHNLTVELSPRTVLCSKADYGASHLKVLIPGLSSVTLLNHRNDGAGAPCVSAGLCDVVGGPEKIVNPNQPQEKINVRISEFRVDALNSQTKLCETVLVERVQTVIRGIPFLHERRAVLGLRNPADCKL